MNCSHISLSTPDFEIMRAKIFNTNCANNAYLSEIL